MNEAHLSALRSRCDKAESRLVQRPQWTGQAASSRPLRTVSTAATCSLIKCQQPGWRVGQQ